MPEFSTTYRGREVYVEIDKDGCVLDIYPVKNGDKFVVTESDKIEFEVDYQKAIADAMEEFEREMAEYKQSRGRDKSDEG